MKAKKLAYIVLALMLFGVGCDMSRDHLKDNSSIELSNEEHSTTEELKNDKPIYEVALSGLSDDLTNAEKKLQDIDDSGNFVERKEEYRDALLELETVSKKIIDLEPKSKYEELHKDIIKSMKKLQEGIKSQRDNIDNSGSMTFVNSRATITDSMIEYLGTTVKIFNIQAKG
ncbi:hypothetical protein BGP34_13590 [Bacillus mycoides]|uniref:hypothetical protein n=1 Tax=Bacillus mycoides TaxID=1405 RepID=UPI0009933C3D|nr:hypothetical protein [Bacillus mycoides]OOR57508.1 hypothetical protein BGP34_13590 [Bacillus mycoides]